MPRIEVVVDTGEIRPLPVSATSVDVLLLGPPCALVGWSLKDVSGDVATSAEGQVVAPGAGAAIVTLAGLAAGTYDVTWQVALQGAAAAADANNFQLKNGAAAVENSINAGAAGAYPQVGARITVVQNGTVTVNAIGAGTAGVTYLAQVELAPVLVPNASVEFRSGSFTLAESSIPSGEMDTQFLGGDGINARAGILLHVNNGVVAGSVYARFVRPPWDLGLEY
jgi:hypothetical protein